MCLLHACFLVTFGLIEVCLLTWDVKPPKVCTSAAQTFPSVFPDLAFLDSIPYREFHLESQQQQQLKIFWRVLARWLSALLLLSYKDSMSS